MGLEDGHERQRIAPPFDRLDAVRRLNVHLLKRAMRCRIFSGLGQRSREASLDKYHVALYIHFVSLLIGIGAASVLTVCAFQLRAARTLADAAPWGRVA
jgi:hypothetical protein